MIYRRSAPGGAATVSGAQTGWTVGPGVEE